MNILIIGGAGYIGSHIVYYIKQNCPDLHPVVYDNLSRGHKEALIPGTKFILGDINEEDKLLNTLKSENIEVVMHFAAHSIVPESIANPLLYYENNIGNAIILLKTMKNARVNKLIFSSTAAVYGVPDKIPIDESQETRPINPYGETKLAIENLLKYCADAYNLKYVSLRYFNAAGAAFNGEIGESHSPETHLIPIVIEAALGRREKVYIFGDDYETRDGTCLRDYIHVLDLAQAHVLALERLKQKQCSEIYNLGTSNGATVKEVIDKVKQISNSDFKVEVTKRRPGDPPCLIASNNKARKILGFQPNNSSLDSIISSALKWHLNKKY